MRIFNILITTKRKQDSYVMSCMESLDRVNKMSARAAVNPVIHSLKELRKNTWDKERVDQAIKWLEDNFMVEDKTNENT